MIVSGAATGVYLVTGSEANLFSAQELYEPIELRPQAAYFRLSEGGHVQIFRGHHCAAAVVAGTKKLADQLAKVRNVSVNKEEKPLTDLR